MQGFCANPAIFAANALNGWGLVNTTEDDLCTYAMSLADKMVVLEASRALEGAI